MAELEQANLGNIGDGELEQKFQAHLKEIAAIFADPRPYVQDKDGNTKLKISMEVGLVQDSNGTILVSLHSELKRPKRKGAGGWMHRRGDKFLISQAPVQGPLFDRPSLTAVPGTGGSGKTE